MNDEQTDVRMARNKMAESLTDYAKAYGRPGVLTGFVVVYELSETHGQSCWWITGTGGIADDLNEEGLAPHRALGLLDHVISSIRPGPRT